MGRDLDSPGDSSGSPRHQTLDCERALLVRLKRDSEPAKFLNRSACLLLARLPLLEPAAPAAGEEIHPPSVQFPRCRFTAHFQDAILSHSEAGLSTFEEDLVRRSAPPPQLRAPRA